MTFRPNYSPLALKTLDEHLGSETQRAYSYAIQVAPHLEGMAIILNEDRSSFRRSRLGLAGGYVAMAASRSHYADRIVDGTATKRMGKFKEFFLDQGIRPKTAHLVTSVFLHELGHADDYQSYINQANGDTQLAFMLANDVRKSELATLPLRAATSHARKAWAENTNGYQDQMRASGVTDTRWQELQDQNIAAYADIPCEAVADRFALGVLATMYTPEA
jgi:hypothetical protein